MLILGLLRLPLTPEQHYNGPMFSRVRIHPAGGFSLVQVMVAMGLMSVLALGLMRMMSNQVKGQKSMRASMEIDNFINELRLLISRPGSCEKTFENMSYQDGMELMEIRRSNGETKYLVGNTYGFNTFKLAGLKIKGFSPDDPEAENYQTGLATLEINLEKKGQVYGGKTMSRKVDVVLQLDKNKKIVGCSTLGGASLLQGPEVSAKDVKEAIDSVKIEKQETKPKEEKKNGVPEEKIEISAKVQQVQEVIESNPQLKAMQEAILQMKKANEEMKKMLDEQ